MRYPMRLRPWPARRNPRHTRRPRRSRRRGPRRGWRRDPKARPRRQLLRALTLARSGRPQQIPSRLGLRPWSRHLTNRRRPGARPRHLAPASATRPARAGAQVDAYHTPFSLRSTFAGPDLCPGTFHEGGLPHARQPWLGLADIRGPSPSPSLRQARTAQPHGRAPARWPAGCRSCCRGGLGTKGEMESVMMRLARTRPRCRRGIAETLSD